MGVPSFFRWLSRKYPSVIVECIEEEFELDSGEKFPVDASKPNPNGVEFDNLYLDMNGIIHPCTHPEDKPAPKNEDEMMVAIFESIDRLFAIVRPRKLLYMAIDGVAPRAKMNQQRSRRFRASKESQEKKVLIAQVRQRLADQGCNLPPEKADQDHFDSNCITPGTPFMDRLSKCLHYYIHDRLNNDPGWANIKVILSDANVPGEGEHKIMDYIRKQRAKPDHDPNTHHMLCGADADLIMLGLATHEPNFTIIREEFLPNQPKPCEICGSIKHILNDCSGIDLNNKVVPQIGSRVKYIFVRLCVLREYLERELALPNLPFAYDFDRALDDWVFMCFFVGNDFLPHLPSLEIRENAIDRLVRLYKDCCYKTGGWLTDSGKVNMKRVQLIMQDLSHAEDLIFKERQSKKISFERRLKRQKMQERNEKEAANHYKNMIGHGSLGIMKAGQTAIAHGAREAIFQQRMANSDLRKRKFDEVDSDEEPHDEVRLYEGGYKTRYYESKFEVKNEFDFPLMVANEYAIGLCWVLRYYYQGCASWKWYFPYHYAPFASDFNDCVNAEVKFELGTPFRPLEQLMGVFPAASRDHVPEPWGKLMIDPNSDIIDFYPQDFKIDLNGKKFAWQGVALLPFVDETRLKATLSANADLLTEEEKRRNIIGNDRLYISKEHCAYKQISDLYRMGMSYEQEIPMTPEAFQGMNGTLLLATDCVKKNGVLKSPVAGLEDITQNMVVVIRYKNPSFPDDFTFHARRLEGAEDPPRVLKPGDIGDLASANFQPRIGFSRLARASLSPLKHKEIRDHLGSSQDQNQNQQSLYNNVPPPQFPKRRHNNRNHLGRQMNQNYRWNSPNSRPQMQRSWGSGSGYQQQHQNHFPRNNRGGSYRGRYRPQRWTN